MSEVEGHRCYRRNKEKKRRKHEWYFLIALGTIHFFITLYLLEQDLNPFFRILLVFVLLILFLIVYRYLIHKIFLRRKNQESLIEKDIIKEFSF